MVLTHFQASVLLEMQSSKGERSLSQELEELGT